MQIHWSSLSWGVTEPCQVCPTLTTLTSFCFSIVRPSHYQTLSSNVAAYNDATTGHRLLMLSFESVQSYLYLLQLTCTALSCAGDRLAVYLAAAVSDFYIPRSAMAEHKIQSSGGNGLSLRLSNVPKAIGVLRQQWAPRAYVVTFKLETDEAILASKAHAALKNYGHELVIGNLLATYKQRVSVFHAARSPESTPLADETGCHLDSMIVQTVACHHEQYMERVAAGTAAVANAGTDCCAPAAIQRSGH
jgi:phosphopantothenate-cysteine ligase